LRKYSAICVDVRFWPSTEVQEGPPLLSPTGSNRPVVDRHERPLLWGLACQVILDDDIQKAAAGEYPQTLHFGRSVAQRFWRQAKIDQMT